MKRNLILFFYAILTNILNLQIAKAEITRGAVRVLSKPEFQSKIVYELEPSSQVSVLEKSGLWTKITASVEGKKIQGWVKSYQVGSEKKSAAVVRNSSALQGKQNRITGVKGLTEENIAQLPVNPEAVSVLETYRSDEEKATDFSKESLLIKKTVSYFGE
ncbi:MAG: SH3 domain-containing protein [Pseudobdellovibrio sp.]